jgi:putative tricarboxylic transport membrane protein
MAGRGVAYWIEVGFAGLVILMAGGVLASASGWAIQARLFPTVVAVPLLVLGVVQLAASLRQPAAAATGEAEDLGLWHAEARSGTLRLALWLAVFLACIALASFPLGLPLGIFLYLRFESRESWLRCLLLAAITFGYMELVFDRGLHLPWPEGLLTRYVGI